MSEFNVVQSQWNEYESLLNKLYDDVPDDWDMYEDTRRLREGFAAGKTARELLGFEGRPLPPRHTFNPSTHHNYDGSELGD